MATRQKLAISLGLAASGLFLWLALHDADFTTIGTTIAMANPAMILPFLGSLFVFYWLKSSRWTLSVNRFFAKLLLFVAAGLGIGPAAVLADPGSIELFYNETGSQNQDHILQTNIPAGFGSGEFTLELWIRPNNSFPVGTVLGGEEQRRNWAIDDNQPYTGNWWFRGNFLLDGGMRNPLAG